MAWKWARVRIPSGPPKQTPTIHRLAKMLARLPHRGRGGVESIWSPNSPKFGLQPLRCGSHRRDGGREESRRFEQLCDSPDAGLRLLCQHATDMFAVVRFGLLDRAGMARREGFNSPRHFFAQNARPPNCFKMVLKEFEWLSDPKSSKFSSNTSWIS